jgi:phosphatidylglycerophosphate synthase
VRPLVGTVVTPNHLTTVRLTTGIAACVAFAVGGARWDFWGGVMWIGSCLLDRADGELARLGGTSSPGGHLYDFYSDVAVSSLFFFAIGVGLRGSALGWWSIAIGGLAGGAVAGASILSERLEKIWGTGQKAYAGIAGFDFDDVLYLFAPAVWLGWSLPLLVGAAFGAPAFLVWTWMRLRIVE